MATAPGILFVISAPSGTGKSSLVRRLLAEVPGIGFSVSYTTRSRRDGEEEGREYHFVDDATFDRMVAEDAFLEWAPVFSRRYGTGREATLQTLARGQDLLLDIDVQGARRVREGDVPCVSVFVLPPDYATLESRLRLRGSDDARQIALRLAQARVEADEFVHYDYVIVNDSIQRASNELRAVVGAERARRQRRERDVLRILDTFPSRAFRVEES